MSSTTIPRVVPAQLSFLAIYNPSLGLSDETFQDQIVFYYSRAGRARSKLDGGDAQRDAELKELENEKLRQVGLAQGMVGFARSFSNGEAVSSVETKKSRIVLRELEENWWILASVDLTQLPAATSGSARQENGAEGPEAGVEYSSREVSPPALLLQQLLRAHSVFLLHHGASLQRLFTKSDRTKFCNILDIFWTRFASNWDVLLHGSPSVDIFGGMKLAAGGELGMGVGEEEWGSGEREVLEDFARRTEGLVDVVVSRFGEPSAALRNSKGVAKTDENVDEPELTPWMGCGKYGDAPDGVVFSGIGSLTRKSLRDVSLWAEDIYTHGEYAYGVKDNPATGRRKRKRRDPMSREPSRVHSGGESERSGPDPRHRPGIPPPIITSVEASLDKATNVLDKSGGQKPANGETAKSEPFMASLGDTETWMKYLTLGYGSAWGGKQTQETAQETQQAPVEESASTQREASPARAMQYVDPEPDVDHAVEKVKQQIHQENNGFFVIGLKGDMGDEGIDDDNDEGAWNHRIPLRTVNVELATPQQGSWSDEETPLYEKELTMSVAATRKLSRLRPVVYVHRPFIYTFLFHPRTESLSFASFYRNLHTYFHPLHAPLANSTCPSKVASRISAASNPYTTVSSTSSSGPNTLPIYDLVFDPRTLTVHSSLPNIPDPGTLTAEGLGAPSSSSAISPRPLWTRMDALNVHSQILATVSSTRRTLTEIERTCKTSRSWWVVWLRLPPSDVEPRDLPSAARPNSSSSQGSTEEFNTKDLREAFLVRRARDGESGSAKSGSGKGLGSAMWRFGGGSRTEERMGGRADGWGPRGLLGEGIGIDARRYVEGLLSLNR